MGAELDPETRLVVAARLGSDVPFFLGSGPALVEGRGERVAPLAGLHGTPGMLLVTPAVSVSTPDVFAAFDAIRTHGDEAVRMTSTHLAEELRAKLSTADLQNGGHARIELRARVGRPTRTVQLALRFGQVTLNKPRYLREKGLIGPVRLSLVEVVEID